jgi:NAD(P)-dependent dehydrogenase (short-subunit alcohol dehydrogenase family)
VTHALIVGAGSGLSAALARLLAREGCRVHLAARDTAKLAALCAETGAEAQACDAAEPAQVAALFAALDAAGAAPGFVLYNPSFRVRGPLVELDPEAVRRALEVCAYGAFLVAQQAARRMLPRGEGAIFLTGASAGLKGFARSAPFAMGKFALRGLGESLARELGPQGIHVCHVVVDGGICAPGKPVPRGADSLLEPDAIAGAILAAWRQPRSAWTNELVLRPWDEPF